MSYDRPRLHSPLSPKDWKVTRSLVSYDLLSFQNIHLQEIERSPDHWWVTTNHRYLISKQGKLKGHQIIGELRHSCCCVSSSCYKLKGHQIIGELRLFPFLYLEDFPHWKVTRSLVSYDSIVEYLPQSVSNWKVTRSLVSYDFYALFKRIRWKLKGHQIIGELRPDSIESLN